VTFWYSAILWHTYYYFRFE